MKILKTYFYDVVTIKLYCCTVVGYVVQPNYFASALKELPMFYDKTYVQELQSAGSRHSLEYLEFPGLVMP